MAQTRSPFTEISSLHTGAGLSPSAYADAVERRRALRIPGYTTLAEVGFDGPWVTPLQITAGSLTGPVLIAYNWVEADAVAPNREELERRGYLSAIPFNRVLDRALELRGLQRAQVYATQCFHLLPSTRSGAVPQALIDQSFAAVTRHEIAGRPVLALGAAAEGACRRAGVDCRATLHPSARGLSFEARAQEIATGLADLI